jgi:hypothetical protein
LSEIVGDGDTTAVAIFWCIIPLSGFAFCSLIGIDPTRMIEGETDRNKMLIWLFLLAG